MNNKDLESESSVQSSIRTCRLEVPEEKEEEEKEEEEKEEKSRE